MIDKLIAKAQKSSRVAERRMAEAKRYLERAKGLEAKIQALEYSRDQAKSMATRFFDMADTHEHLASRAMDSARLLHGRDSDEPSEIKARAWDAYLAERGGAK